MDHDKRIFESWNLELSKAYHERLNRDGRLSSEYYADRLLSNSANVMAAGARAFDIANKMLSCFLGEADRTNDEILDLLCEYRFNQRLVFALQTVNGIEFDYSWNETSEAWVMATSKFLVAYEVTNYAAKELFRYFESGGDSVNLFVALSSERGYALEERVRSSK